MGAMADQERQLKDFKNACLRLERENNRLKSDLRRYADSEIKLKEAQEDMAKQLSRYSSSSPPPSSTSNTTPAAATTTITTAEPSSSSSSAAAAAAATTTSLVLPSSFSSPSPPGAA